MNAKAKTLSFLWRVLTSRVGILLLVINLCLIAYDYSQRTAIPLEADGSCFTVRDAKSFHPEAICVALLPQWLIVVSLLNYPALLFSSVIVAPLENLFPVMCAQSASQIGTFVFAVCSAIQWLIVGYFVERLSRKHFEI